MTWGDIALRISLTVLASGVIGFDRAERGHAAGLRTTILIALAACLAMIEANLLLPTQGKAPDSFVQIDPMRFPLGILSGVGFIGAGAIFKRDDLILGVTTAATLWFTTVIGLCFGGGQIGLGLAGSLLGLAVITGLKILERHITVYRKAQFAIKWRGAAFSEDEALRRMSDAALQIVHLSIKQIDGERCELHCELRAPARPDSHEMPSALAELTSRPGVFELEWKT